MLRLVERRDGGRLGVSPVAPAVRSRRSNLEDPRYRAFDALEGAVERRFLRPACLGESIAPFRVLQPFEGIVPVDAAGTVLDARQAGNRGFGRLADWMERAEGVWQRTSAGGMTPSGRWNFHNGLTNQFPIRGLRVVFSKSGQRPAACIVSDETAPIDHVLHWADVAVGMEAHGLLAVLNSDTGSVDGSFTFGPAASRAHGISTS